MIKRILIYNYRLFDTFELQPNPGMNIVVGDNEAGKSTLLEAVALALTGRINARWAQDELNPYWFNQTAVDTYFASLESGSPVAPPEILIELYLDEANDDLQLMLGVHNSLQEATPGIRLHIAPNPAYAEEFQEYMAEADRPKVLPTEWYMVDWRDFSDEKLTRRPKELGVSVIDSRTIRSTSGIDYHTREILTDFIEPKERAAVSVAHRRSRYQISTETLAPANARIAKESEALHDRPLGLHMDQSAAASWENSIVPQVANVPFAMAGQGQQAAVKVALAMHRSADKTAFALIEEPENHLSHTSLTRLVARIEELAGSRQVFLTTHSSFVLNRLGLDKLHLLYQGKPTKFSALTPNTVRYFRRLSGYDTMRLVLAHRVVLVEGPSDEMIFERAFRDKHDGKTPIELGVDVVSMAGVSLKRGLELCAALNRTAAAIRDNDGKEPSHWRQPLEAFLEAGKREVFIGDPVKGKTLEPQFVNANDETALRELFDLPNDTDLVKWMKSRKTDWALQVEDSDQTLNYPTYVNEAVEFIS